MLALLCSTRCRTYLCMAGWPGSSGGCQLHTTPPLPPPPPAAAAEDAAAAPASTPGAADDGAGGVVLLCVLVAAQCRAVSGPGGDPRPRICRCMARSSFCLCRGLSTCCCLELWRAVCRVVQCGVRKRQQAQKAGSCCRRGAQTQAQIVLARREQDTPRHLRLVFT